MKNKNLVQKLKSLIESGEVKEVESVLLENKNVLEKDEVSFLSNIADLAKQTDIFNSLNSTFISDRSYDSETFLKKQNTTNVDSNISVYKEYLEELVKEILLEISNKANEDYYNIAFNLVSTLAYHITQDDIQKDHTITHKDLSQYLSKSETLKQFVQGITDASFIENINSSDNIYYSTIYSDCVTEIERNIDLVGDIN